MSATLPPRVLQLVILLSLGVAAAPAIAQDDEAKPLKKREPTEFIRVKYDEFKNPEWLQTATAKYVLKENGQVRHEVFLESAVHIGDAAYYRGFNQRFRHYDVVLYELIADPDRRVPDPDNGEAHPTKIFQQLVGDSLGFKHQIDQIDYKAPNMVHADLSPKEIEQAKRQRGDGELVFLADVLMDVLRKTAKTDNGSAPNAPPPFDLDVLSDPDGGIKLRRMLAHTFGSSESSQSLLQPSQRRSLIDDRNERVMEVFQQQASQGKKSIALFWGAAHMPDLEKRLILAYGFEPDGVRWRNAWDLREGAVERAPLDSVLERTVRSFLDDALDDLFEKP